MNVLFLMSDTFRVDHLAAYGAPVPWQRPRRGGEPFVHTPNLDRLAAESALFERFYLGSYPTVPCRYDLFSGRFGFPTRGWQPLEPDDLVLSEVVAEHGHTPMLIYDTPMLGTDSYNYTRGFAGFDFVRGQHADRWVVDPIPTRLTAAAHKLKPGTHAYLRNIAFRRSEADWMCARTLARAMDWLERNRSRDDFVLWLDLWDPHEPFDAPDFDLRHYADPAFAGDEIIYPRYGRAGYMDEAERDHVRALYAALVTVVDRWVGRLLEKLETLGLHRNTLVVFLSDHGHLFGDHGLQGKPTGPLGKLYEVTTRCPLLIRHPEGLGAGRRVAGIAQHPDLLPTVLEFLGLPVPDGLHGRSLWPLVRGEVDDLREFAVSGRYAPVPTPGGARRAADAEAFDGSAGVPSATEPLTLTTREWAYLCPPAGLGTRELYHLATDPAQERDVLDDHAQLAGRLHRDLLGFLERAGMPSERLAAYRDDQPASGARPLVDGDRVVHVLDDGRGRCLAFGDEAEAGACVGQGIPEQQVGRTTLARLGEERPDAFVHLHGQYYHPADLL